MDSNSLKRILSHYTILNKKEILCVIKMNHNMLSTENGVSDISSFLQATKYFEL